MKGILESSNPESWLVEIKNALPHKPDDVLLPKTQRVDYFKIIFYKSIVTLIGKILEQIRDFKTISKQFLKEFKKQLWKPSVRAYFR